jgi:predicted nucleotidyltransferase
MRMERKLAIDIPKELITAFCRKNRIRRLSVFGSALRGQFQAESDVNMLVEFEPGQVVGLIRMAALERELSAIVGRQVDLRTPADLSRYFRDEVMASAVEQYAG